MAISPTSGTRIEPIDSYIFLRGSTATFKMIFTSNDSPVLADTGTFPVAKILKPVFLNDGLMGTPTVVTTLTGSLVAGQQYEYEFSWSIPADAHPNDEYIVSYEMQIGSVTYFFGDEYFTITATPGQLGLKPQFFATVDDVRQTKFNIDSYLPDIYSKDLTKRNNLIEYHLKNATQKLREELNLFQIRKMSENYRLYVVYQTIYTILLASRGEDGSSVSEQNLLSWRRMAREILDQEKREGVMQGIGIGRG